MSEFGVGGRLVTDGQSVFPVGIRSSHCRSVIRAALLLLLSPVCLLSPVSPVGPVLLDVNVLHSRRLLPSVAFPRVSHPLLGAALTELSPGLPRLLLSLATMFSRRLHSALARRSTALTAPPSASAYRLSPSSSFLPSASFSSSSSSSSSSLRSTSSFATLSRAQRPLAPSTLASSRVSGINHVRTMTVAEGQKIKVKNPVVELDGDEVR